VRRYLVPALLLALLLVLQAQLWLGRGSLPDVWGMAADLQTLTTQNQVATQRNAQIANEVRDLQTGVAVVEAQARRELGMVKPNEVFVQYATGSTPPPTPPAK
jgi:cell division protein FtsB